MTKLTSILLVLGAASCSSGDKMPKQSAEALTEPQDVVAVLEPRSGSNVSGQATFTSSGDRVVVEVSISGATPGEHGMHLHQVGDCTDPDAKSAGDHFNPAGKPHGSPDHDTHHAGDLGNISAGDDGSGTAMVVLPGTSVQGLLGRSLIVHADPDDLETQPSGNSGDRVACGVVVARPR